MRFCAHHLPLFKNIRKMLKRSQNPWTLRVKPLQKCPEAPHSHRAWLLLLSETTSLICLLLKSESVFACVRTWQSFSFLVFEGFKKFWASTSLTASSQTCFLCAFQLYQMAANEPEIIWELRRIQTIPETSKDFLTFPVPQKPRVLKSAYDAQV